LHLAIEQISPNVSAKAFPKFIETNIDCMKMVKMILNHEKTNSNKIKELLNEKDDSNKTPIELAAEKQSKFLLSILLEKSEITTKSDEKLFDFYVDSMLEAYNQNSGWYYELEKNEKYKGDKLAIKALVIAKKFKHNFLINFLKKNGA